MSGPVFYSHKDSIAVIRMDDGKVNALGPTMQQALNDAIDQADRDDPRHDAAGRIGDDGRAGDAHRHPDGADNPDPRRWWRPLRPLHDAVIHNRDAQWG